MFSFQEYPHISQVQKRPQDYRSSRQGTLRQRPLAVKKVLQSTIERKSVIQRLQQIGQFRKEFFSFPTKSGQGSQLSNLPTFEITQKTMDYASRLIQRKAAAKFSKIRGRKIRRRRYSLQGTSWHSDTITWNVPSGAWSTKLSVSDVNNTLAKAFRIWAEVSPLVFRWVDQPDQANITVKFATGKGQSTFMLPCTLSNSLLRELDTYLTCVYCYFFYLALINVVIVIDDYGA